MKEQIMELANKLVELLQVCDDEELVNDVIANITYGEMFEVEE